MSERMSPIERRRLSFEPSLPKILRDLEGLAFQGKDPTNALGDADEIEKRFPKTFGRPFMHAINRQTHLKKPLKVGVVLSGGQAAGGHNVIIGLFNALKVFHCESRLYGFLGGPRGVIEGSVKELSEDGLSLFRNQGGFDLIGSGRTKIETEAQLQKSLDVMHKMGLDGLVVIGGDDSNTNAAILAEYCLEKGLATKIIGVPKTIDGDLKNKYVEISFGFDTACKTYAEMIGNIARDAISAKKYTHFIRLMGRSASHIALECALLTHPNLTLIGEEVAEKKQTLKAITEEIAEVIEKRKGDYGVILIPEGLIEFIPEMKTLIEELNYLLSEKEYGCGTEKKFQQVLENLSSEARMTFTFLPKDIQLQLLIDRDPHGNVQVSHIQTEKLFSETVKSELKRRNHLGKFNPVHHFFGYEGRSGLPSNFDATYCIALGMVSALLIREGLTGYMSCVNHLTRPPENWGICGIPITSLMNMEVRNGKEKPVIRKSLVDLNGPTFKAFKRNRDSWKLVDHYRYPGPIQFEGDATVTDQPPLSLII